MTSTNRIKQNNNWIDNFYGNNFLKYDSLTDGSCIDDEKLKSFIQSVRDEAYFEGYKKGVKDEIVCVETSGEHLDLQKKL